MPSLFRTWKALFRLGIVQQSFPCVNRAIHSIRKVTGSYPNGAVLQVNCALGKVPDEHQVEGVSLAFEGGSSAPQRTEAARTWRSFSWLVIAGIRSS